MRKDRHKEANSYFLKFCEPTLKGKRQLVDITLSGNANVIKKEAEIVPNIQRPLQ
jgi:hypothetical protein